MARRNKIIGLATAVFATALASAPAAAAPALDFTLGGGSASEFGVTGLTFLAEPTDILVFGAAPFVIAPGDLFEERFRAEVVAIDRGGVSDTACAFCAATTPGDGSDLFSIDVSLEGAFTDVDLANGILDFVFTAGSIAYHFGGVSFATGTLTRPLATGRSGVAPSSPVSIVDVNFSIDTVVAGNLALARADLADLLPLNSVTLAIPSLINTVLGVGPGPGAGPGAATTIISVDELTAVGRFQVPLPGSTALMGVGLIGLVQLRRRR